jgi:hypothetical protein
MSNTNYNRSDVLWSLMVNQLLNKIAVNKMSQDDICAILLGGRKVIGSKIYLQKDRNT